MVENRWAGSHLHEGKTYEWDIQTMVIEGKEVNGSGLHPEAGPFTILGKVDGHKITFCKTYGDTSHKIYY